MLAEAFAHHPLPGIQLEQRLDRPLGEIGEAAPVPDDLRDVGLFSRPACLIAYIAHVIEGAEVFGFIEHPDEVHPRSAAMLLAQFRPRGDKLFWDRIELIAAGLDLLKPVPLHDRGLEQRGRGIGVVFRQFRWDIAVESWSITTIEIGIKT